MGTDLKNLPRAQHGSLLLRLLYGGRDAPMRGRIAPAQRFRSHGFAQMRTDVRTFNWYNGHGKLQALVICHVDDISFTGTAESLTLTENAMRTCRAGGTGKLTPPTPIAFTGLLIESTKDGSITLSQPQYAKDLNEIEMTDYVVKGRILDPAKFRIAVRQGLGALIWLRQTRPDIGFDITKLATDAVAAATGPELGKKIIILYNKIIRFAQLYDRKLTFDDLNLEGTSYHGRLTNFTSRRVVCFADAGFSALAGSHSIEGSVTILGKVINRYGVVRCHGYLIDRRCAKIQMVCKSSLAAEAHASATAADQALWLQVYLAEIFTGSYQISQITPPTEYPLPDPFGVSPTDQEVAAQRRQEITSSHPTDYNCGHCQSTMARSKLIFAAVGKRDKTPKPGLAISRPLLLTDCCSLFSAILRIQPSPLGKCAKLI